MPVVEQASDLPESWWDLRPHSHREDKQRDILQNELRREVDRGHLLHGRTFAVIARSQAQDDILLALDDKKWAIVHLTWQRAPEVPPWPVTTVSDSLSDAIATAE
jgi:hypothetical protein